MELIRKNIHMDHIKATTVARLILESDQNVPDTKPDIQRIDLEKGKISGCLI